MFKLIENSEISSEKIGKNLPLKYYVPGGAGTEMLKASESVRQNGRFPILTYYDNETKASIWRSAEPNLSIYYDNKGVGDQ